VFDSGSGNSNHVPTNGRKLHLGLDYECRRNIKLVVIPLTAHESLDVFSGSRKILIFASEFSALFGQLYWCGGPDHARHSTGPASAQHALPQEDVSPKIVSFLCRYPTHFYTFKGPLLGHLWELGPESILFPRFRSSSIIIAQKLNFQNFDQSSN
jgi:hypothetical protein